MMQESRDAMNSPQPSIIAAAAKERSWPSANNEFIGQPAPVCETLVKIVEPLLSRQVAGKTIKHEKD